SRHPALAGWGRPLLYWGIFDHGDQLGVGLLLIHEDGELSRLAVLLVVDWLAATIPSPTIPSRTNRRCFLFNHHTCHQQSQSGALPGAGD
ncbi:MAG: hypothetical protein ACI9HE_002358, partial [Planctomycetota bacterium]